MSLLTRKRQVGAAIESVEGTAETLAASDAKILAYSTKFEPDPEFFIRNPYRAHMSPVGRVAGVVPATASFGLELRGSGSVSTAPEWLKLLRACGFVQKTLQKLTIGAVTSGPFTHGETITQAVTGATGVVIIDTADGTTTLYFYELTGTWDGTNDITGGTSGASATPSALDTGAGFVLIPSSTDADIPSLTLGSYEDGTRKLIKGARGKCSWVFDKVGSVVMQNYEFMGAWVGLTDTALLTIDHESTVPPAWKGTTFAIDAYSQPRLAQLDLGFGGTLAPRDDANNANGISSFRITERDFTGSMQMEMVLAATHDFYGNWLANTEMAIDHTFGSAAGNTFRVYIPKAQYSQVEDDEKDGIAMVRASIGMNGTVSQGDQEIALLVL